MKRLLLILAFAGLAVADVPIYNSLPSPLPPNLPSLGNEATQTSEFGDLISFAGTANSLTSVTVAMSNWAYESEYVVNNVLTFGTPAGFIEPLTLNLYNVGANNTVGSVITSETVDALIPWRPEPDPADCAPGSNNDYKGSDGQCYSGSLSTVTFNLAGTIVPNSIIYGLSYNTGDYGTAPYGAPGPYNSLNFALATVPPSVGSNPLPDTAYWNTTTASNYTDGGAAGVGVFRQDTGWSPYSGAIEFNATVPEASTVAVLAFDFLALSGIIVFVRKRILRAT